MRVCRTVQGEQPMSWAACPIPRGWPSAEAGGQKVGWGGHTNGPCCAGFGPGCPGQCPGQHWPRDGAEKGRKRAGLRALAAPAFGSEFARLMAMIVSLGTAEQPGKESPQEAGQVHVEVPEEGQHEANEHELKQKLGAAGQGVDQADQKQQRDADEHQARQGRQKQQQRCLPQRNPRVRHGEVAGAALAAGLGIARIGMPLRAELEIVGASAEVAEQRLAWRDAMALVAVAHRESHRNESLWPPVGRSQTGDQKPSR